MSEFLLKEFSYTQKELQLELRKVGLTKSQSSISRDLKAMKYSRKRLVRIPEDRNSEKNKNLRQAYGRMLSFVPDENLVFLDETGVNLHQSRNYGYSPKNCKAVKVVKSNKTTNISCMVPLKKMY